MWDEFRLIAPLHFLTCSTVTSPSTNKVAEFIRVSSEFSPSAHITVESLQIRRQRDVPLQKRSAPPPWILLLTPVFTRAAAAAAPLRAPPPVPPRRLRVCHASAVLRVLCARLLTTRHYCSREATRASEEPPLVNLQEFNSG